MVFILSYLLQDRLKAEITKHISFECGQIKGRRFKRTNEMMERENSTEEKRVRKSTRRTVDKNTEDRKKVQKTEGTAKERKCRRLKERRKKEMCYTNDIAFNYMHLSACDGVSAWVLNL